MKTTRPPRYYVGTVSGWALHPATAVWGRRPSGHSPLPIVYTVHDRYWNHRTVAEFAPSDGFAQGGWKTKTRKYRERKARELCDELNARYEAWLADDPERLRVAV